MAERVHDDEALRDVARFLFWNVLSFPRRHRAREAKALAATALATPSE